MKNSQLPNRVAYFTIIGFTLIVPIFFLPSFASSYLLPKTLLATMAALILLIIQVTSAILTKEISIKIKAGHIPVLLILVAYILSTFIQSPNFHEAWIERTLIITSLSIIYFSAINLLDSRHKTGIYYGILSSTIILSLLKIAHSLNITQTIGLPDNNLWNPTGTPIALITILLIGITIAFSQGITQKNIVAKSLFLAGALIQGISLAISISELFINEVTILNLPYSSGYAIAIDILKHPQSALFGMGPDNFLAAFTFYKPIEFNQSDLWNVRFTNSSNELFHIFTITGLFGVISFILMNLYLIKNSYTEIKNANIGLGISTIIIITSLLLFPANATTLSIFYIIIIVHGLTQDNKRKVQFQQLPLVVPIIIVTVILIGLGLYYPVKYGIADARFQSGLIALRENKAQTAFNQQQAAIRTNPYRVSYRIAFSQTNMLIARALASQENLTQEQQTELANIIRLAVNQARVASALNPQNVNSWENQAQIYQQLTTISQGADVEALRAYNNAIVLDPRNPRLRVSYGQFLQTNNQIDGATQAFRQAVSLKNSYANAHYNLAAIYEAQQQYLPAYQSLQQVLSLIPSDSESYPTVSAKRDEIQAILQQQIEEAQSQNPNNQTNTNPADNEITTPTNPIELPDNVEVDLPQDSQPEPIQNDNSLLPSPTPTPSSATTPTPTPQIEEPTPTPTT